MHIWQSPRSCEPRFAATGIRAWVRKCCLCLNVLGEVDGFGTQAPDLDGSVCEQCAG